jgi:serine/threonine protein kinase
MIIGGTGHASPARPESERVAQDIAEIEELEPIDDRNPKWDLKRGAEIDPTLVVVDTLGLGTRYEAYRAWDRKLFCEVAVKVIRPHRVGDDRALEGFERETSIGMRLSHPYLVRFLRWSHAPPRPYLVMEYVYAQTLGDHLADVGPVSVPETCLLGIRMAGALHHLHQNGVLHLDVKPHNVTMGDPPKLLDLSLARAFSGPVKLRHTIGTDSYMPPEQCDHGEATPQSDLFSLGATLYESVSGTRPFPEGDATAEQRANQYPQLVLDPVPLSDVADPPRALEQVVMACLQRDPARRPRSAVDIAVALENVLEGLGLKELFAWPKGVRVRA